uniref:Hornerin-like n=2 Tax=Erpetoichthys calabaricus TaxID=27687 RepID=A0A8C4RDC9_ERPCA
MKHLLVFTLLLALLSSSVLSKKGRGGIFGGSKTSKKTSSSSSSKSSWSSWSSNSNTQGGGNTQSRPNLDNPYRSGAGGSNWGQNNNRMPNQQGYGYGQNQPGYGQNQPGYGHNQPGYGHNQPGYGQNQPGYGQNQPGYGQNQPGYGYGHNQPGYGYGHNQPGYGYGHNQPGYGYGHNPGYGQGYGYGYGKNYGYKPKGFGKNSMVAAGVGAAAGAAVGYGLGRMYSRPWMDIDFDSPDAARYYRQYMERRYGHHRSMYRDDDGYNYYYERPPISYNDFIESCMRRPNLLEMPRNCSEPGSPDCLMQRDNSDSALVELFLNWNVSTANTTSTDSNTTTTTSTTPSKGVLRDTIKAKAATDPELATQMKLARCIEEYVDYTHQYLVSIPQSRATSIKLMNTLIFLAGMLMLQGFF